MKNKFPYRYRVLILLFFLILITYLDRVCISLVGVRIKTAFNLSNTQFGYVLGAFALAYALFEIPAGILGDRIGQKKVFIRIVIWWSIFTAITGATTGFITLMFTRFLFGMGEAGAFPNGCGTISRWFPVAETSKGTSCLMIGSSAGAAIAPLIVVPIAAAYGWRAPFFVNGLIGLVWVLVCFAWFKNEPGEMKNISVKEKLLIENNRRFINHEQKFPWRIAFKNRSLWALALAAFCSQWALYFFLAWMPVYLQEGRHFSETAMKFTTSYLFVVGIIGGLFSAFFIDRFVKKQGIKLGRRLIGMIALGIMCLLFITAAITTSNAIASACLMFCYFFIPVNGINYFSACVDIGKNKAGTVAGIINFSGSMGAFFLSIVFGKIADVTHNFNTPLFVVAGVLFAGCLLWLLVDASKPLVEKNTGSSRVITADKKNLVIN
ncbi:MAG: MFS transporter [Chitinophagaceae bacterium]